MRAHIASAASTKIDDVRKAEETLELQLQILFSGGLLRQNYHA
jgi:hypothetical protein